MRIAPRRMSGAGGRAFRAPDGLGFFFGPSGGSSPIRNRLRSLVDGGVERVEQAKKSPATTVPIFVVGLVSTRHLAPPCQSKKGSDDEFVRARGWVVRIRPIRSVRSACSLIVHAACTLSSLAFDRLC